MPKFAANISTMFPELPVEQRFSAARELGFTAVEFLFPYAESCDDLKRWLHAANVDLILLNTPLGDAAAGERGLGGVPGRQQEFRRHIDLALRYAAALDVPMVHVMAGVVAPAERSRALAVLADNVRFAADAAAERGIDILLEPLNTEDTPGYLLTRTEETRAAIERVGRPNVRLQFDFYHRQIMEGNLARRLADNLDIVGHVQFSSVPGRLEPQYGEVNLPHLFNVCDELGYDGWIGCEYRPKTVARQGMAWGAPYGLGPRS